MCVASGVACAAPSAQAAESSILRNPGEHPRYAVEIEPEAIVPFDRSLRDGPGVGVRAAIPLMHNGFVSSINDSPAIGFGISRTPAFADAPFYVPVVLEWNFFVTTHLSVLGEAGAFIVLHDGDRDVSLKPAFMGGARWHFSESVALTARVSLPASPSVGVGVSFFF